MDAWQPRGVARKGSNALVPGRISPSGTNVSFTAAFDLTA